MPENGKSIFELILDLAGRELKDQHEIGVESLSPGRTAADVDSGLSSRNSEGEAFENKFNDLTLNLSNDDTHPYSKEICTKKDVEKTELKIIDGSPVDKADTLTSEGAFCFNNTHTSPTHAMKLDPLNLGEEMIERVFANVGVCSLDKLFKETLEFMRTKLSMEQGKIRLELMNITKQIIQNEIRGTLMQNMQLIDQVSSLRELVKNQERQIGQKDHVIDDLMADLRRANENVDTMKEEFRKMKEQYKMGLAAQFRNSRLQRRCFLLWKCGVESSWKNRFLKQLKLEAREECMRIKSDCDNQIQKLQSDLKLAHSQLDTMQAAAAAENATLRTALMRGVCALNMETMNVFHGLVESGEKSRSERIETKSDDFKTQPRTRDEDSGAKHLPLNPVSAGNDEWPRNVHTYYTNKIGFTRVEQRKMIGISENLSVAESNMSDGLQSESECSEFPPTWHVPDKEETDFPVTIHTTRCKTQPKYPISPTSNFTTVRKTKLPKTIEVGAPGGFSTIDPHAVAKVQVVRHHQNAQEKQLLQSPTGASKYNGSTFDYIHTVPNFDRFKNIRSCLSSNAYCR